MGTRRVVIVLIILGIVAGATLWLGQWWRVLPHLATGCRAEASGEVSLETTQMANAATIAAVGVRLGVPERGVVVALATAFQESKLRNLPHLGTRNDHDSIGLFQQRPSQGWGTEAEIRDPRYAAERFYQALQQVEGWQDMRITDAAQRVQLSAFPEAYEQWADHARVLATALLGTAGAAVTCTVPGDPPSRDEAATSALAAALRQDWGEHTPLAEADQGGLSVSAADQLSGWRYAHWLVAHAATHGVTRVQFADLAWTAAQGEWRPVTTTIDHVLAEVAFGR